MKKFCKILALVLCLSICFTGCLFKKRAKGENAKIDYTGEASVYYYPVCPECGHVSEKRAANLSDGEYGRTPHTCERCYETYVIEIDRR